jgi:hypothetical protein
MSIEELVAAYEKNIGNVVHVALPPTRASVARIEKELGIKLPGSMVQFAMLSPNYGNWLASLGPDYYSSTHIVAINKRLESEGRKPKSFVAINIGYDGDYSCIDTETYDHETDEYLITYWASDVPSTEAALSDSFPIYMEENIECWRRNS